MASICRGSAYPCRRQRDESAHGPPGEVGQIHPDVDAASLSRTARVIVRTLFSSGLEASVFASSWPGRLDQLSICVGRQLHGHLPIIPGRVPKDMVDPDRVLPARPPMSRA